MFRSFEVLTFNLTMFCQDEYVVEPSALRFLISHGFDFNKQISDGIHYRRGPPPPEASPLHDLFRVILSSKKPIVLHNGFVDLVFLYQHLHGNLPRSFQDFVADLTVMFTGGIVDTKYIAEFHRRETASFLEYLFRKWQRASERGGDGVAKVCLAFPDAQGFFERIVLPEVHASPLHSREQTQQCEPYAAHGHCRDGPQCRLSHDLDVILDHEERGTQHRSRKRRRNKGKTAPTDDVAADDSSGQHDAAVTESAAPREASSPPPAAGPRWPVRSNCHRAGFDAFMTGFCAAQCLAVDGPQGLQAHRDRVYLSGKPFPLLVAKSRFSSYSTAPQGTSTAPLPGNAGPS